MVSSSFRVINLPLLYLFLAEFACDEGFGVWTGDSVLGQLRLLPALGDIPAVSSVSLDSQWIERSARLRVWEKLDRTVCVSLVVGVVCCWCLDISNSELQSVGKTGQGSTV